MYNNFLRTITSMTDPTQNGPVPGQPTPPPQPPTAPPQGWPTAPPQQGGYAYGRPPAPPAAPADPAVLDRICGGLLILAAALTVGGSFAVMDRSVDSSGGTDPDNLFTSVAKAWSYSSGAASSQTSVTQLFGVPLLIGSVLAVVAAVLLLAGLGRRIALVRVLAVAGAGLLAGTTLTVATSSVNDTQWDSAKRTTTLGAGFWLIGLACLVALAAAALATLTTRTPATTTPRPAPAAPPAPWGPPAPQHHHQPPSAPAGPPPPTG